jgi:DNA replication factor GINS
MDIEEISQVLYKEKNQTLKTIPADFYLEAEKYIKELETEIKKNSNPRAPESKMLNNEFEQAISDLETIFMKRIAKVITRATNQSHADKPISKDIEKLLPAEKKLYDLVLRGIEAAKAELLGPILYPGSVKNTAWPEVALQENKRETTKLQENKGETTKKEDYVVVRILKDLPTFTGADGRNYTVGAEDVVVLPQLNATGLIKRNAAKLVAVQASPGKQANFEKR